MAQDIYKEPIFLNSVGHRYVKVAPLTDYLFAREFNSAAVAGPDLLEAAKWYPVVFTRDKEGAVFPAAILGLRQKENLYVNESGQWEEGVYVPLFFRRYPFGLSADPRAEGQYGVCVDFAYEGFGAREGMELFDGEGNQTPELKQVVDQLLSFQSQFDRAKKMCELLDGYGLLKGESADITLPGGEKIGLGGWMRVDENDLANLPDDKALELFRAGYLTMIYAHLGSLSNFWRLMKLADAEGSEGP